MKGHTGKFLLFFILLSASLMLARCGINDGRGLNDGNVVIQGSGSSN